jgi:putative membrane protein
MKRIVTLVCACVLASAVSVAGAQPRKGSVTRVSGLDKASLKMSMQGDLFEVQGGKLAQRVSSNQAVIRLAKRLVTDHSKSYDDAAKLARRLGVAVPTSPSPSQQWELAIVSQMRGRAFNHWYSSLEVFDHVQDIQETTDEIQDGTNADVVKDARTELPMLRMHLRLARQSLTANP